MVRVDDGEHVGRGYRRPRRPARRAGSSCTPADRPRPPARDRAARRGGRLPAIVLTVDLQSLGPPRARRPQRVPAGADRCRCRTSTAAGEHAGHARRHRDRCSSQALSWDDLERLRSWTPLPVAGEGHPRPARRRAGGRARLRRRDRLEPRRTPAGRRGRADRRAAADRGRGGRPARAVPRLGRPARRRRARGPGARRARGAGRARTDVRPRGGRVEAGVEAVLDVLRTELRNALHLAGVASAAAVPRDVVWR